LKQPIIKQFKRLPPSRYIAMQACLLREVWTASGNAPLLPPSACAELGCIAHRLLQTAGRGELKGIGCVGVDTTWNALLTEAEARMVLSPLTRHLVPLRQSVPDFQVRKLRTCRKALEIANNANLNFISKPQYFHPITGSELWIESNDGLIGGYIDRARLTSEGLVLSDYKSGTVLETKNGKVPRNLKSAYSIQMELYAALYWKSRGTWPARLEVVPLQGETIDVKYDPKHAEYLLEEAKLLLHSFNSRIAAVQTGNTDVTGLATPQPEHCKLCLFRPECNAYWLARQREPNAKWPLDVKGVVQDIMHLRNGRVCIRIETSSNLGCTTIRNITDSVDRHPILQIMSRKSCVAIYGLKHDYRSGYYTETYSTVIY
jgi:hypothetical protein